MVQLQRRHPARHRGDHQLSECTALPARGEQSAARTRVFPAKAVNVNPAFTSKGTPRVRPRSFRRQIRQRHQRCVERPQYFLEIVSGGAQLQCQRNGRSIGRAVLQYLPTRSGDMNRFIRYGCGSHAGDRTDLFADLANDTLPAVSYVKPDVVMDRPPRFVGVGDLRGASRKVSSNSRKATRSYRPGRRRIFVTVGEGGGFYDSEHNGIQPVDFFGTGPRIPMIVWFRLLSTGGHIRPRLCRALLFREVRRTELDARHQA